jgi:hypothetical protein
MLALLPDHREVLALRIKLNHQNWSLVMKRNISLVLVLWLAASVSGMAQHPNVAETVFNKWKQAAPADEVSRTHFALAAVTRRTADEVAELDLWSLGRAPEVVVEVQPVYFEKLPNGEQRREQAGVITRTSIGSQDGRSVAGDNTSLKIILPVRPNANALEIKWVVYARGEVRNSTTIEVWLKGEPSESLTRITSVDKDRPRKNEGREEE